MKRLLSAVLLYLLITSSAWAQSELNWTEGVALTTYESADLNSLAYGFQELGASIDNTVNGDMYMLVEAFLDTAAGIRKADAAVHIYLLKSVDGTNYDYGADADGQDPAKANLACSIEFTLDITARYNSCWFMIPSDIKFKLLIENDTGKAFAAANNTIKYRTYNQEAQ